MDTQLPSCLHAVFARLIYDSEDSKVDRARKTVLPVMLVGTLLQVGLQLANPVEEKKIMSGAIFATAAGILCYILVKRRVTDCVLDFFGGCALAAIVASDALASAMGTGRRWSLMVVIIDLMLVCQAKDRSSKMLIFLMTIWLTVDATEQVFRLGIYEGVFPETSLCSCDTPPCREVRDELNNYGNFLLVFFLDFYFTRSFFRQLLAEQRKMQGTIQTVQHLAHALSNFDTDHCEAILSSAPIPASLHREFSAITSNLSLYKVYLPDGLFSDLRNFLRQEDGSSVGDINRGEHGEATLNTFPAQTVEAPGTNLTNPIQGGGGKGDVVIVFTDIKNSTEMWEATPAAMRKALSIHNSIIRTVIAHCSGYEVKTIGDAFMVAFKTAEEACRFGLQIQEQINTATFPADLDPLRIRVGVNCGQCEVEYNPIIGRFDYHGPFVNKASRVEAKCIPGGVAVTENIMKILETATTLPDHVKYTIPNVKLKGVSVPEDVTILVPTSIPEAGVVRRSSIGSTPSFPSMGESFSSTTSVKGHHFLKEIKSLSVCCATIDGLRPEVDSSQIIHGLTQMLHGCDRVDGSVLGVYGNKCFVTWNTAKKCTAHFHAAVQFAGCLTESFSMQDLPVFMGIGTGQGFYGVFGNGGRRFLTLLGPVLRLSEDLSNTACKVSASCLHATAYPHPSTTTDPSVRSYSRPITTWPSDPVPTIIYELKPAANIEAEETLPTQESWGWSEDYRSAFFRKDWGRILQVVGDEDLVARWAARAGMSGDVLSPL